MVVRGDLDAEGTQGGVHAPSADHPPFGRVLVHALELDAAVQIPLRIDRKGERLDEERAVRRDRGEWIALPG